MCVRKTTYTRNGGGLDTAVVTYNWMALKACLAHVHIVLEVKLSWRFDRNKNMCVSCQHEGKSCCTS